MDSSGLTAAEIFEQLNKGRKIFFKLSPQEAAKKILPIPLKDLLNHLNVLKSQAKKIYLGLGLLWEDRLIVKEFSTEQPGVFLFFGPKPEPIRYAAFIISEESDTAND